ncbi:MAG: PAS domain-containing sensor histidine kinase [Chloroflexi bacterium]|nr:PAS domain-containing sensor histidine kinase [Chloroflexota bacterium]
MAQNMEPDTQTSGDPWQILKKSIMYWALLLSGVSIGLLILIAYVLLPQDRDRLFILELQLLVITIVSFFFRAGHYDIANHLFIGGFGVALLIGPITGTGIYTVSYIAHILLILLSTILYTPRMTIVVTTVSIVYGGVLVALADAGQVDTPENATLSPFATWISLAAIFAVAANLLIQVRKTTERMIELIAKDRTFYQTIISDQSEFIVRWKLDGRRTFVNDAYCRYFNLTPQEAIGTNFMNLIAEKDRARVQAKISRISFDNPVEIDQHEVINPDGSPGWQQWTDRGIFDSERNLTEYQSVGRDITPLMILEQHQLDLEMSTRREKFLRDFLNMISHDLKTPLTIMENNLYLIRHISESPAVEKHANRIERQIDHLTVMINDILTTARLDYVEYLDMESVDLKQILDEARQSLADTCELKHIDLKIVEPLPPIAVRGDEKYLKRAFVNLFENAIKYSPRNSAVTITGSSDGEQRATITITDSGMGIDAEDLPHIFERFYRAKNVRDVERGTGLGLAIVNRVIELHGGSIAVESMPGTGSTFTLKLPLYQGKSVVRVSAQADL